MLKVKTKEFQGSLELLLSLIEKKELEINNFSLFLIINDFIQEAEKQEKLKKPIADFLIIISTLMLIKSKTLIPNLKLESEEEADIENLKLKLKLFQCYLSASKNIKDNFLKNTLLLKNFKKISGSESQLFIPASNINLRNLEQSISVLLEARRADFKKLPEIDIEKTISIEDFILNIREAILKRAKISLNEMIEGQNVKSKKNYIVGFLAILEMYRKNEIEVFQESNFSDIFFEKR